VESERVDESRLSRGESAESQRKPLAAALRTIYAAPSADVALSVLEAFERGNGGNAFPRRRVARA
jgi:hypothetical protein